MGHRFFSGSNSGTGFYNYFNGIVPEWEHLHRYFLIKGGPGVGKSTLMKRVVKQAEEAGEEVECFYCSGDPDSLDAVRLVKRGIVFADATSPHCMDPNYPGAVEEIVSLGDYIQREKIGKRREEIETLTKSNKVSYRRAYAFLGAAAALREEARREILSCIDEKKIEAWAKELGGREEMFGTKQNRNLFLDAISCKGRVHFDEVLEDAPNLYRVHGRYRDTVADRLAKEVRAERKEWFCDPLFPQNIRHLLIRENGVALTVNEGKEGTGIDSEEFLKKDCHELVKVYETEAGRLEEEAIGCLKECKKIHDKLEEQYKECVDFAGVTHHTERLLSLLKTEF